MWWICVWLSRKITINGSEQIPNLFWLYIYSRNACSIYCRLPWNVFLMLPSPESWVIARSAPGYTQVRAEKTAIHSLDIKLRDCLTSDWAQRWFDHPWASDHLVCTVSIQIRSPVGEILCWVLVSYSSQSRWLTIYMHGSLSNAAAVLQLYRRQGKRVDRI